VAKAAGETLTWVTSSHSGSVDCVEWARPASGVFVRDTKGRERGRVAVSAAAWQEFTAWAKRNT
jgi:hypothetical protein